MSDEEISREKIDGINTQPENEKTISIEKCQSDSNPTPSTSTAQGKGFSPTPGVNESLSRSQTSYFRLLGGRGQGAEEKIKRP